MWKGIEIDIRDSIKRRGFTVTAVYANHDRTALALVDCNGLSLYFIGDTLFDLRLLVIKNYKPDIMCVCIKWQIWQYELLRSGSFMQHGKTQVCNSDAL